MPTRFGFGSASSGFTQETTALAAAGTPMPSNNLVCSRTKRRQRNSSYSSTKPSCKQIRYSPHQRCCQQYPLQHGTSQLRIIIHVATTTALQKMPNVWNQMCSSSSTTTTSTTTTATTTATTTHSQQQQRLDLVLRYILRHNGGGGRDLVSISYVTEPAKDTKGIDFNFLNRKTSCEFTSAQQQVYRNFYVNSSTEIFTTSN